MAVIEEIMRRAAVVSDELGPVRQGYDVRGTRQLQSECLITHLAQQKTEEEGKQNTLPKDYEVNHISHNGSKYSPDFATSRFFLPRRNFRAAM